MLRDLVAVLLCVSLVVPASCGRRAVKASDAAAVSQPEKSGPDKFKMPIIPASLIDEQEKLNYMLLHYWDGADFYNEAWVQSSDAVEEIFGNFIFYAVRNADQDASRKAVDAMMKAAETAPGAYDVIVGFVDKYLYDPNSPVRNEELYIVALESQIANPKLDDIYKVAPRERLRMAMKNRLGSVANDFSFTTSKGVNGTLHEVNADYTLLFFYNLGCPACREVRLSLLEVMKNSRIADMMKSGRLKVIALYPDKDMTQWDRYAGDIPADWTNAYDPQQVINDNELYDLRAIPSLYLLDKDKRVLIKDFIDTNQFNNILAGDSSK